MIDEVLVKRAKTGDKDALVDLIMAKQGDYYRLALVHTGNPEDAMDALQDMCIIASQKINRLQNNSAFYAWSMTILVNCCRRITRRPRLISFNQEIIELPSSDLEKHLDLITALEKLKPAQKEAIKLKYLLELDYETIATVLKIPVGTAKSRVFVGLRHLKTMLGGIADE